MLVVVAIAALATPTAANKGLVNSEVKRSIVLWSSIAKQELSITILNEGSTPESAYDFAIQEEALSKLSFMTVTDNDAKSLDWKTVDLPRSIQANGVLIARYVERRECALALLDLSQRPDLLTILALGSALCLSGAIQFCWQGIVHP